MDALLVDLRYAVRQLRRSPIFMLVAVLSLGLGIGINTTVFSAVNALLLQPLPVPEPDRIVGVYTSDFSGPLYGTSSYPDYLDFQARTRSFAALAAAARQPMSLTTGTRSDPAVVGVVSDNYFTVVGRPAAWGRLFTPDDGRPNAAPVVVLAHDLWQRRFSGDSSVVGRTITLGGDPVTVAGIGPKEFASTVRGLRADLWLTVAGYRQLRPEDEFPTQRGSRGLTVFGRLAPGASLAGAQAELSTLAAQLTAAYPEEWTDLKGVGRRLTAVPESRLRVFPAFRATVLGASALLLTVTALVLLIACANLANLLMARGAARRKEIAVRLALGATRSRVVRQLLTESVLLAGMGCLVGLLGALWATEVLSSLRTPTPIPINLAFTLDGRVLAFAIALSLGTGVLLGLAPALDASRPKVVGALRGGADTRRGVRLRGAFVVAQVAGSLVLLVVGALFLRSLHNASRIDPGFATRRALVLDFDLRLNGYSAERSLLFYRELQERLRALPGVEAVGLTTNIPLGGHAGRRFIAVRGYMPAPGEDMELNYARVGPDYFATMGVPLALGRGIDASDRTGAPEVVVVNETFVRRFWPGQNPIGKQVGLRGDEPPYATVVGIARDGRYNSLGEEPLPFYYMAFEQDPDRDASVVIRSAGAPGALANATRETVRALDPNLPISAVTTLAETLDDSLLPARLAGGLLGLLGALGLAIAMLGLYGVMAYSVAQRTHEIGIRMALGAHVADVLRLVLERGMRLTGIGLLLGLVLAIVCGRLARGFLFGLSPSDPLTHVGVALLLLAVALGASYIPALRAARLDPVRALRTE